MLGLLAYRTYQAKPPIPERAVAPSGEAVYTERDVERGQEVFLNNGLMEYGSVYGHGAAWAGLHRRLSPAVSRVRQAQARRGAPDAALRETIEVFRPTAMTSARACSSSRPSRHRRTGGCVGHYSRFFSEPTTKHGLRPDAITDRDDLRALTAFFGWTAWTGAAERPGHNYSYTNNWPPEPRVDNKPTANVIVWSVLSLIALLRHRLLGAFDAGTSSAGRPGASRPRPASARPATSRRLRRSAPARGFFVMAALFVLQTLVGAASQHYRAELASFSGSTRRSSFPFNLMRPGTCSWRFSGRHVVRRRRHLPRADDHRREPRGQGKLAFILLGALAVVVFWTLIGASSGSTARSGRAATNWFGLQGFEYLDLARVWQILLTVGLFVWLFMLWRVLRTRLRREHAANMPWLFFLAALAIPAFYAVGLIAQTGQHFTVNEFWRFGVVHPGWRTSSSSHDGDGGLHVRPARSRAREGSPSP